MSYSKARSIECKILIFYSVAAFLLLLSFIKDRQKTKKSLMKALKSFENIYLQMLGMIIYWYYLSLFESELSSKIIGGSSKWYGVIIAAIISSITLIPAFVCFSISCYTFTQWGRVSCSLVLLFLFNNGWGFNFST